MSKIIPILLPYTKACGLYGPGFNYSMSGSVGSNPILASSRKPYSGNPQIETELIISASIGAEPTYNPYYSQLTIEILHTSGTLKYSVVIKQTGLYTTAIFEPCGTIPNCVYGLSGTLDIHIKIFSMLRSGIDVTAIKVQVNTYGNVLYNTFAYWSGGIGVMLGLQEVTSSPEIVCPSLTNYKTITLDKSTGFVFTIT